MSWTVVMTKATHDDEWTANSIMKADSADTPTPLTVAEQTLVGRITSGVITALSAAQVRTLLNITDGATPCNTANVDTAGAVMNADYNAQTILAATSDDTPAALTVDQQTVVGRLTGGNIKSLSVAELQTLILSAALPENVEIRLTAAPSQDGKYSGIVEDGTAGATLAFGDLCCFNSSSRWVLAKGDAASTASGKLGICVLAAASNGNATRILLYGKVNAAGALPTLTIGAPAYLDYTNAGDVVVTMPAKSTNRVVRIVGYGNTADELFFCPENTYMEYA